MSSERPENGWWQASDGRWYPPEQHPDHQPDMPPPPPPPPVGSPPAGPDSWPAPPNPTAPGALPLVLAWTGVAMFVVSTMIEGVIYSWESAIKWRSGYTVLTDDWYELNEKVSILLVSPGLLIVLLALAIRLTARRSAN